MGYEFDLRTNAIDAQTIANPQAGKEHHFMAYRIASDSDKEVVLVSDFQPEDLLNEEE